MIAFFIMICAFSFINYLHAYTGLGLERALLDDPVVTLNMVGVELSYGWEVGLWSRFHWTRSKRSRVTE
jgi:hypothetical protein